MKEKKLIKEYIENNKLNIEKIMQEYTSYLYTIIKNKNINLKNEDVEEIISDVFLAVWKNQDNLEVNKEISPYLAGIAKNVYNNKKRYLKSTVNITEFENTLFEKYNIEQQIEDIRKDGYYY